ncbi:unnamed protein product [Durusdinium trenchii]|uniref:Protein kinase domain-containing protein n=1 Tax=Durusdinium trenchii TaxID=1381693 RepID=A0ABP0QBF8_9DINO
MARVIPLQQVDQRYVSPGRPTPLLRHATPTASPWGARSVTPTQSPVVRRAATPVTTPGQLPVYGQLPAFPSYTAAVGVPAAPVAGLSTWSARPAPLELAVGIVVRIGAVQCMISEPLGMGSFGVVWAAKTSAAPQEVAVKEMICNSDTELGRAEYEIKLLKMLSDLVPLPLRIPSFMSSELDGRRVRLAMSRLPGHPLDRLFDEVEFGGGLMLENHTLRRYKSEGSSRCQRTAGRTGG